MAAVSPSEVLVIVPARMAATRLPGKPLADINGIPMVVHVLRRAIAAGTAAARPLRARGDAMIAIGGAAIATLAPGRTDGRPPLLHVGRTRPTPRTSSQP